ncbi:S8 family serine peptidase [Thermoproteota archaeon]
MTKKLDTIILRIISTTLLLLYIYNGTCFGIDSAAASAADTTFKPGVILVKTRAVPNTGFSQNSHDLSLSQVNHASFHKTHGALKITPITDYLKPEARVGSVKNNLGLKSERPVVTAEDYQALIMIEFSSTQNIQELMKIYSEQTWVEYAEPLYYIRSHSIPNDPMFPEQTYLSNTNLHTLLDLDVSESIIIAVPDTGVDYTHPDLQSNILVNPLETQNNYDDDINGYVDDRLGYNFCGYYDYADNADPMDENDHGTHISGIISALTNNHTGISGIHPDGQILAIRFLDKTGWGTQIDAAMAIYYAVERGARVINCSWGFYLYNQVLEDAVNYAYSQGVIIVASAGNSNTSAKEYPAAFDTTIAVGSVDLNNNRSGFSNYGDYLDFMSYGETILSTKTSNGYGNMTGTSQSAAVVSGIIARLLAHNPDLSFEDIYNLLRNASTHPQSKDEKIGFGTILPDRVYASISNPEGLHSISIPIILENVFNYPNPFGFQDTHFNFDSGQSGSVMIRIYDLFGRLHKRIEGTCSVGNNHDITWDGCDENGRLVNNGTYFYLLQVSTAQNSAHYKGKLSILR